MSMFATPAPPGEGIQWEQHKGALLLIEVTGFEAGVKTRFGENDAVVADITVLDGAGKDAHYDAAMIFPKLLVSQTKNAVGQKVLGRLGQGQAKSGQSAPWLLEEASAADVALAEEWVRKNQPVTQAPAAPF
jgi:hypothetical protein